MTFRYQEQQVDRGGGAPNRRKKARMEALVAIKTGRFMQVREAATRDLQQKGGRTMGRKEECRESSASQGGRRDAVAHHPCHQEEGRRERKGDSGRSPRIPS